MNYLLLALLAFLTTYCFTPIVITFANRFHLIDNPKIRKHPAHTHSGTIARAGGVALLVGISIPTLLFLPLSKALLGIVSAALLTNLIGVWDDYRDVSPYFRFVGNISTALLVIGAGVGIPFITNPLDGIIRLDTWRISFTILGNTHTILIWADIMAMLWIIWMMNIIGWSSGIDGQMPGFVAITAIILGILSLRFSAHDISQTVVAALAFITAGAFLGFLPWNFYPQKIMPGYGGKTLAGLMLSTIAILSGGKIGSALIILAIPMIDAIYALFRRLVSRKSPFLADRAHLHHRLLDLGWGKRRIALFYWSVSAILGVLTLTFNSQEKIYTFVALAVTISGIILWLSLIRDVHLKKFPI